MIIIQFNNLIMFQGYKIKPDVLLRFDDFSNYFEEGKSIFSRNVIETKKTLDNFINSDNVIDGTDIINNWFPEVDADVFISHSHIDERFAIELAGWLKINFGIKSFIDSCVWGYANNLLKSIDKVYCFNPQTKLFDYNERNYSTSHVHMMLATALTYMIDKCECMFFIDSENSIKPYADKDRTHSPWIYLENVIANTIRTKIPERHSILLEDERYFNADGEGDLIKSLNISYQVNFDSFQELLFHNMRIWHRMQFNNSGEALDFLYKMVSSKSNKNLLLD